jgi:hypothetical protein
MIVCIVTDLLKAFLGNGSVNRVNVQQWKMCLNECYGSLLSNSQGANKLAG